jgi:hypothetical protein
MEDLTKPEKIETVLKLDLACGQNKKPGFVGVDIGGDADVKWNLTRYPWPFDSDSVQEINCSHYFEHMTGEQQMKFMDECWRIMKTGAKMFIVAPYYTSMRAVQDPTHKSFICEASFVYYNKEWRKREKLDHYPIKCDFDFEYAHGVNHPWTMKSEETRNFAITHYWNAVSDIHVTLTKRPPEPAPPVPPAG